MDNDKVKKPVPNYLKNIKINTQFQNPNYNMAIEGVAAKKENQKEKEEKFKQRLEAFKKISTLKEAKELLDKTIPISLDRTTLYIGNAKCVIINSPKQLRICYDSPDEFISFDFV